MTRYDDIYEIATNEYGIVTAAQAREAGVTTGEMSRWCSEGEFIRHGHGVYKLMRLVPTPYDASAETVTLVGEGGYLWGESVPSLHGLTLVDPQVTAVAIPKRVWHTLPPWIEIVPAPSTERMTSYEGVPSQRVADAIETCRASVMPEHLINTVEQVCRRELLTVEERERLKEDLS